MVLYEDTGMFSFYPSSSAPRSKPIKGRVVSVRQYTVAMAGSGPVPEIVLTRRPDVVRGRSRNAIF